MKTIKLSVTQNKRVAPNHNMRYTVDDPAAPGIPFVGHGRSLAEALGNWVIANTDKHNLRLLPTGASGNTEE